VSVVIVGGRFVQEFAFRVAEAVPGSAPLNIVPKRATGTIMSRLLYE